MDRNSIIGFVLIAIIIGGFTFYQSITTENITPQKPKQDTTKQATNSAKLDSAAKTIANATTGNADSNYFTNKYGKFFSNPEFHTEERLITIETDNYKAIVSSKGGVIKKWYLKNYKSWDKYTSQLINDKLGELNIEFTSLENKKIDTRELNFTFDNPASNITLKTSDKLVLNATLKIADNKYINRKITFYGNQYAFDNDITLANLEDVIPQRGYNYTWNEGLRYQELNSVDESKSSKAMTNFGDEIENLKVEDDNPINSSQTGQIRYTAVHTKYFLSAIMPKDFEGTTDLAGKRKHFPDEGIVEYYEMSYRVNYKGGVQTNSFKQFLGPLNYDIVSAYGLERTVDFGWWIVRYIGEYFMMPIFNLLYKVIPNYGVTILLFSLFMKLLLTPLSMPQMRSAQKMKLLQPEIDKIRAKHNGDATKEQQEIMQLYGQYGLNPLGGCLPLLLQMPILYSLWAVLNSNIELRQTHFAFWITDLSVPDTIVHFGTSILGISSISGLALLMSVTMFVQQKMTITDPRQKATVYMMPVMFLFLFSSFPAGLNLYYFLFNVWSIAHQWYYTKFTASKITLEELKKAAPKKESWFQQKIKEAQRMAEEQGRVPKGTYNNTTNNDNQNNKNRLRKKK
jgi:YidC/Oxa1 family membrane protein insertase